MPRRRGRVGYVSHGGIVTGHRSLRVGNLLRFATEQVAYDSELVSFKLSARGGVRRAAEYANDPDNGDFRARRSRGWKAHKHRYQWEHRVRRAEKRAENRRRKGDG